MLNLKSELENETQKICDFAIQTDHLIPARRPDLVIANEKETLLTSEFCCFS